MRGSGDVHVHVHEVRCVRDMSRGRARVRGCVMGGWWTVCVVVCASGWVVRGCAGVSSSLAGEGGASRRQGVGDLFGILDEDADGEVRRDEIEAYLRRTMGDGSEFDTAAEVEAAARDVVASLDFGGDGDLSVSVGELGSRLSGFMNADGVAEWVAHGLRLPQYASAFLEAGVEAEDFPLLLADAGALLEHDIGVTSALHRAKITRAMRKLVLGIGGLPAAPGSSEGTAEDGGEGRGPPFPWQGHVACGETEICGEVVLSWAEAAKREDSGQVSYRVQRRKGSERDARWEDVGSSMGGAFVDVPDPRLGKPGAVGLLGSPPAYDYRVQAWNHIGGGGWSEPTGCLVTAGRTCVPAKLADRGAGVDEASARANGAEPGSRSGVAGDGSGSVFGTLKSIAAVFSTLTAGMQLISTLLVLAVTFNVVPRRRIISMLRLPSNGWDPALDSEGDDAELKLSTEGARLSAAARRSREDLPSLSRTRSRESMLRDNGGDSIGESLGQGLPLPGSSSIALQGSPAASGTTVVAAAAVGQSTTTFRRRRETGRELWLKAGGKVAEQVKSEKKAKKICRLCAKLISGGMWYERHWCRYCQAWVCADCTHHAAHSWFSSCDGDSKCVCSDSACMSRYSRMAGQTTLPTTPSTRPIPGTSATRPIPGTSTTRRPSISSRSENSTGLPIG